MTETLNIDHHTRLLLEKALAKSKNVKEAGKLLGVSGRTVERLKARYGIRGRRKFNPLNSNIK